MLRLGAIQLMSCAEVLQDRYQLFKVIQLLNRQPNCLHHPFAVGSQVWVAPQLLWR